MVIFHGELLNKQMVYLMEICSKQGTVRSFCFLNFVGYLGLAMFMVFFQVGNLMMINQL